MQFPKDHYTHETPIEWWYFWGKLNTGEFFHLATFASKLGGVRGRATHWSLHNGKAKYFEETSDDFNELRYGVEYIPKGNWWSIECAKFHLRLYPEMQPVIHNVLPYRNYYSIPELSGEGLMYPDSNIITDAWMDHEFSQGSDSSNWDWIGTKLNSGMKIMCGQKAEEKSCSITFNNKTINSDFILENKHLFIHSLGMYLTLEPLEEEIIFDPQFGFKYSEVPFNVISKGTIIGYGMRERTYHKEKEDA